MTTLQFTEEDCILIRCNRISQSLPGEYNRGYAQWARGIPILNKNIHLLRPVRNANISDFEAAHLTQYEGDQGL
jgi:hypothetical protein